jgi:hypothetical protein
LVIFAAILHYAFKAQAEQKSSDAVFQPLPDLIQTTNLIKKDAIPVQLPVADTRPEGLLESYRLMANGKQDAALDKIIALICLIQGGPWVCLIGRRRKDRTLRLN